MGLIVEVGSGMAAFVGRDAYSQPAIIQSSMRLTQIDALSPQQRAVRLGLDVNAFPHQRMSEEVEAAVNFVKRRDRSDYKLSEWRRREYSQTDATQQLQQCPDDIERRHISTLTPEEFTERYEKTSTPVVITGCTEGWPLEKWSHSYFLQQYGKARFKVGEDDDGYKLRLPFHQYLEYLLYNQDDSPLYLFESALEDKPELRPIIQDYTVPPFFQDDLFRLAGDKRPPFRWLIMGPERSGTTIHVDPLMTSAWNASLKGHKRWVLFGRHVPKSVAKGREFRERNYDDEAINYFVEVLPRIREKYSRETLGLMEFIQGPGETVFVPGGLWHAVVNLDDTIAVTQNVMTHFCFDSVWRSTRCERRKFAESFLLDLQQQESTLHERAVRLNEQDRFSMGGKYCQQEVSLSFTPSASSSSSSSSSAASSKSSSSKEECLRVGNRVQVQRASRGSSRSSSSQSRSREKQRKVTQSQQKRPVIRRRLSLGSN